MSRLTRQQIDFIEDYLIKNKVKYWDIRLELVDHIASDIEKRMQNGQEFEEALKEIHVSFGNRYRSKRLNPEQTEWIFTESLYADNSGYKKLIFNKQKELNKRFRICMGKTLVKLFKNPLFILVYLLLAVISFKFIDQAPSASVILKYLVLPLLVLAAIPVVWAFLRINLKNRGSLYLNLLIARPTMIIGVLNIFTLWPELSSVDTYSIWVFMGLYALFFPLVVAQLVLFKKETDRYKSFYKKWRHTG